MHMHMQLFHALTPCTQFVHTSAHGQSNVHVHTLTHTHMRMYMYTHLHTRTCACTCTHTYTHAHAHTGARRTWISAHLAQARSLLAQQQQQQQQEKQPGGGGEGGGVDLVAGALASLAQSMQSIICQVRGRGVSVWWRDLWVWVWVWV